MAFGSDQPVFVISVAAELAGMHPQTLRQYDRIGLVQPSRAPGKARRYSQRDVRKLQQIQELSAEGVSLEGIKRIMQLEAQLDAAQAKMQEMAAQLEAARVKLGESSRIFAAGHDGDVIPLQRGKRLKSQPRSQAVVLYRPHRGQR